MPRAFRHTNEKDVFRAEVSQLYAQEGDEFVYYTLTGDKTWGFSPHFWRFEDDDEVQEVMTWFKGLSADFYDSGMQKLVPRLNKCLDNAGDYVKK